jgi:hypothetical protein
MCGSGEAFDMLKTVQNSIPPIVPLLFWWQQLHSAFGLHWMAHPFRNRALRAARASGYAIGPCLDASGL